MTSNEIPWVFLTQMMIAAEWKLEGATKMEIPRARIPFSPKENWRRPIRNDDFSGTTKTSRAKVLKPPQREAHFQQKCSRRYSGSTTFAGHLSRPLEPLGKIIDQKCSPRHSGKPTFDKSAHGTTTGEGPGLTGTAGANEKQRFLC